VAVMAGAKAARAGAGAKPAGKPADPWGAVPIRAAADTRLSGSHFRVLTVIARHAGFGKNGTGCYASQQTLSEATGLHITTISHKVADLVEWGYLSSRRQKNRRRKQYNVIYGTAETDGGEGAESTDDTCSDGQVSSEEGCSDGQVSGPNTWPTSPYKDIPLRGSKRNSAEAALGTASLAQGKKEIPQKQHHNFVVLASDGLPNVMGTACRLRREARDRPLTDDELAWLENEYAQDYENAESNVIGEAMSEHDFRWTEDVSEEFPP
jgi:hypothetical protein